MTTILCVGSAVLDFVFGVSRHPAEDEEVRASSLRIAAGGNAANSARVLRALGHDVSLAAVLADHPATALLEEALRAAGVGLLPCSRLPGLPPLSAILLSEENGRRTIVHHRDTPEYGLEAFSRIDLSPFRWAHFEARPGPETARMVRHAHLSRPELPLSIEVEKARPGIEPCYPLARLVLFSRGFIEAAGFPRPEPFLREMRERVPGTLLCAAWGDAGAFAMDADRTLHHAPAARPERVVDTIGAGDTFNAGMIGGLAAGRPLSESLEAACRLAGRKVGRTGFAGLEG